MLKFLKRAILLICNKHFFVELSMQKSATKV